MARPSRLAPSCARRRFAAARVDLVRRHLRIRDRGDVFLVVADPDVRRREEHVADRRVKARGVRADEHLARERIDGDRVLETTTVDAARTERERGAVVPQHADFGRIRAAARKVVSPAVPPPPRLKPGLVLTKYPIGEPVPSGVE